MFLMAFEFFRRYRLRKSFDNVKEHIKELEIKKNSIFNDLNQYLANSFFNDAQFSKKIQEFIANLLKTILVESRYVRYINYLFNKHVNNPANKHIVYLESAAQLRYKPNEPSTRLGRKIRQLRDSYYKEFEMECSLSGISKEDIYSIIDKSTRSLLKNISDFLAVYQTNLEKEEKLVTQLGERLLATSSQIEIKQVLDWFQSEVNYLAKEFNFEKRAKEIMKLLIITKQRLSYANPQTALIKGPIAAIVLGAFFGVTLYGFIFFLAIFGPIGFIISRTRFMQRLMWKEEENLKLMSTIMNQKG